MQSGWEGPESSCFFRTRDTRFSERRKHHTTDRQVVTISTTEITCDTLEHTYRYLIVPCSSQLMLLFGSLSMLSCSEEAEKLETCDDELRITGTFEMPVWSWAVCDYSSVKCQVEAGTMSPWVRSG